MITIEQRIVLQDLRASASLGATMAACDGSHRDPANQLCALGFAAWRGHALGSSFFAITEAGRKALAESQ